MEERRAIRRDHVLGDRDTCQKQNRTATYCDKCRGGPMKRSAASSGDVPQSVSTHKTGINGVGARPCFMANKILGRMRVCTIKGSIESYELP